MTERRLRPGRKLRHALRRRGVRLGAGLAVAILLAVLLGPVLWSVPPEALDLAARNQGASLAHPLGTDQLGRDMLARLLVGGRVSLSVAGAAMALSLGLGTAIGIAAGYLRRLDGPLMRLTDLFLALPLLPLLLVTAMLFRAPLTALFGAETGIFVLLVLAIGLTSWMPTARILRAEILSLREREFIIAARASGTRGLTMITRHVLPNIASPILVSVTLGMSSAIVTESALSFLGLGFPPDFASWGRLLSEGTQYLTGHPGRALWPGAAISATVLAVTWLGDGLGDVMDARRRSRP